MNMKSFNKVGILLITLIGIGISSVSQSNDLFGKVMDNLDIGVAAFKMNEEYIKTQSIAAVAQMDKKNPVAKDDNEHHIRLSKIVDGLTTYEDLTLNFKVYLVKDVNAFATPDGSIRVFAGLMDLMTDEQIHAVIGHEIGHVKLKHAYNQMRQSLTTQIGFRAAAMAGGTAGQLSQSQLGKLANAFLHSSYSQGDELESDAFSVKFLKERNSDPRNMIDAIEVLQEKYGAGSDFLTSHPSNTRRIQELEKQINQS